MKPQDEENIEGQGSESDDKQDFLLKFIEQKKLQNRVLGEIIEKINKANRSNKPQTINKNKKP